MLRILILLPASPQVREVGEVMKKDLGMKFKRVKPMSIHANSEKNLVLRQLWTIEFLRLWGEVTVIELSVRP